MLPDLTEPAQQHASRLRHNLRASTSDGMACSVMIGIGENYLPAFALALGMGELVAGWIACVPLLAGAVLQLVSPACVRRIGSVRRWVVLCVAAQALSFIPLIITALSGHMRRSMLFVLAAIYWGSGMASGPAWANWMDTLVPQRSAVTIFRPACRSRADGTVRRLCRWRNVFGVGRAIATRAACLRDPVCRGGGLPPRLGGLLGESK